MKNIRKKLLNKKIIIGAVAVVAVIGLVAVYMTSTQLYNQKNGMDVKPVNTVDYNEPTEEEKEATDTKKEEIIDNYEKEQSESDKDTQSSDIAVTISRLNQTSVGLSIGTIIEGVTSGTCDVTITKAGEPTITKSFSLVFEATSAFCQEAVVPLQEFSAEGEWTVQIIVKSGDQTSAPATGNVAIDK